MRLPLSAADDEQLSHDHLQVSDFGLTKFQDQMKKEGQNQLEIGSIHWSAPEVLSEKPGIDYEAADVYR